MALIKEEHFGIARKIVSNMTTESWREIPHAIVMYEADVTDILPVVKALNANCKSREEKITLNTVMMKIICEGLKAAPSMNTHLLFNRRLVRGCLKYFDHIDVSMPMLLPDGQMMTVNMRDMGNKTLSEMTAAIVDTERRARNSNMDEVMYEVSLDNTLQRLKQGKVAQTVMRLIGNGVVALGVCHYARTLLDGVNGKGRGLGRNDLQEGTTALVLSVNRAYVGDGGGALLNIFLSQAVFLRNAVISFLGSAAERVHLVLAGLRADQPTNGLFYFSLFQTGNGVVQGHIKHHFVQVGVLCSAGHIGNVIGHSQQGFVLEVSQVDGHHSAVRQQHGHRNVNVLKGLQLAAHQLAVVIQVAVHHRCRFQPLDDGFHQNRIQGDLGFAGRAQFLKLGHQVGYIRLIYISHMGDLLPALSGHIGNNLSLNVEVFGSCDFHTCASPLVTVFSNCIAEIRCGILLTVLVSRAFP